MKNPFKVGDLVKLRPDVLGRHSRSIPAHAGFTTMQFQWRDTLRNLAGKKGKITRVFSNSKNVNVEYEEPWESKDVYNRSYTVNTIRVNYTDIIPYAEDPNIQEALGAINPVGLGVAARQLISQFNHRQINHAVLTRGMEELMWRARTQDVDNFPMLKGIVDKLKAPQQNNGIRLRFEEEANEGVGYVYDKDMKKDKKHIKGKRWTIRFESEPDLDIHGHTSKSTINEGEVRDVIQELIKEMRVGFKEDQKSKVSKPKIYLCRPTDDEDDAHYWSPDGPFQKSDYEGKFTPEKICPEHMRDAGMNEKKVIETRETRDKNYIIFGRSGPTIIYYTNTPTQGEKMVQFGQSMAYPFQTLEQVRNKIIKLKEKYKGITNWDYEIVQNPNTASSPSIQPISPNRKGHTVSKPVKKASTEEWFIRWAIDGKTDEGKSYYTDDKQDAIDTYSHLLKLAAEENKKLGIK